MPETFGRRLQERREQRQVALSAIAEETKIKLSLLEGLERDDVSRWPGGIFRRAFIRSYARAIGLDPDVVVREFLVVHPDPVDVGPTEPVDGPEKSAVEPEQGGGFWRQLGSSVRTLTGARPAAGGLDLSRLAIHEAPISQPAVVAVKPPEEKSSPVAIAEQPEAIAETKPPEEKASPRPEAIPETRQLEELDLCAAAQLCTELGQLHDPADATERLARASQLLNASGAIVWVWEPIGAALQPALTHGYSPQVVTQLPLVRREADNATAAAFRSARLAVVAGGEHGNGALAVPVLAPTGCVGVLALELPDGRERLRPVQAMATILAAQMATLTETLRSVAVAERRRA